MFKGITRVATTAATAALHAKIGSRAAVLGVMALQLAGCGSDSGPTVHAAADAPPAANTPPAATAPSAANSPPATAPPTSAPPAQVLNAKPSPYSGMPLAIPGTIDAVHFDRGGEGVGYHDMTAVNTAGELRPDEGVDIRVSSTALDGNDVVTEFDTGEWLAYTIDVGTASNYEVWLRASSAFNDTVFHVEVNGRNLTGPIIVTNTGNWDAFLWMGGATLSLGAGRQVLKVVADHQYFDLDAITIVRPATPPPIAPPDPSAVIYSCSFNALPDCAFDEQAEVPGRASLTKIARDGGTALMLHTEPGDNSVAGSGAMERDDVYLAKPGTLDPVVYGEGVEQWWAHSIYLPDDFQAPRWQPYVLADFHNFPEGGGAANFMVNFRRQPGDDTAPASLQLQGFSGDIASPTEWYGIVGVPQKNIWYDFVYHIRWSSGPDGFFDAWVNGKRVLAHRGPTLYAGHGVYFKLANYHLPVCDPYPACVGSHQPSSVIHDRVVLGTTAQAVSGGPLEGYLDLVNGVLIPRL